MAAAVGLGYETGRRMQPPSKFAERFLVLRKRLGMNQTKLAAALGCSQAMVSAYETGKAVCSISELLILCDLTGASADWLIGRSDFEHGLAPDQWIADEDAIALARAHPKRKGITVAFKVPRKMQVLDHGEFEKLKRELGLQ